MREVDLQNDFHLDSDRQQDHRHDETCEQLLLSAVTDLQLGHALGDGYEELLQVVFIEWHLVDVAEDTPVHEMADKAGESGDSFALDFIKGHIDVLRGDLLGGEVNGLADLCGGARLTDGCRPSELEPIVRPIVGVGVAKAFPFWLRDLSVDCIEHCLLLPIDPGLELLVGLVWDDIDREVFDELCEVPSDVCNGDVQWLLKLLEPVSALELLSWEEVLGLGHLLEGI